MMKKYHLRLKESDWRALRGSLLQEDCMERQAFLEMGKHGGEDEIILHKIVPISDCDYAKQNAFFVMPKDEAVVNAYQLFINSGVCIQGHVHSHPFTEYAHLSSTDTTTFRKMASSLSGVLWASNIPGEFLCFQMVLGRNPEGFEGHLTDLKGEPLGELSDIITVGDKGINRLAKEKTAKVGSINPLDERLNRNVKWFGAKGQEIIADTHLAICGLGGVGAIVAAAARGLGFREITLVDPDKVEPSNLNRLVGARLDDVGAFKVEVAGRMIQDVMPETCVNALPVGIEDPRAQDAILRSDVIVSAVDGLGPRAELQILAARFLRPLLDLGSGILVDGSGAIKRMGSQIIVYIPGMPCLRCQGIDLFAPSYGIAAEIREKTGYVVGGGIEDSFTPTSVVTINQVVGGWATDLLIRYLVGLGPIPHYVQIDQWKGKVSELQFEKNPACPICGEDGIEGKGKDYTPPLHSPMAEIENASDQQLSIPVG